MQGSIIKHIRSLNAAVAGSSDITSAAGVDTQGWDGIQFILAVGTLTANQVTALEAQGCATLSGSYAAFTTDAITPAFADGDSNKIAILDIYRPQARFVKPIVKRATANAVVDCVMAILYKGSKAPVTSDSTVSATAKAGFVSP